jgi:down-regulator of transcription 1
MLYTEANEVCTIDTKNTITADHVLKAVERLDLQDWLEPLQKALAEYKDNNKPAKPQKAAANMNDEELVRSFHW